MCVPMVCWSQTILTLILYVRDSMSICIFHPMHNYYYAKKRRILYEKEKWIIMIWCEYGSCFAIPNPTVFFSMGIHLNLIRAHLFLDAFLLMLVLVVVVVMVVLLLYSLRFVFFLFCIQVWVLRFTYTRLQIHEHWNNNGNAYGTSQVRYKNVGAYVRVFRVCIKPSTWKKKKELRINKWERMKNVTKILWIEKIKTMKFITSVVCNES